MAQKQREVQAVGWGNVEYIASLLGQGEPYQYNWGGEKDYVCDGADSDFHCD